MILKAKRIFMSYGMHNKTKEEQKEARSRLRKRIKEYCMKHLPEYAFYNTVDNSDAKTDGGRLSYLGLAIQKMDTCDAIIFDDDWYKHEGCIIERHVAELYGLEILGVDDEEE